jgi:hypothetical protein
MQAIPVICDRCRAEGASGEDPFAAFGALLDFEPVPRLKHRPDGWLEEVQRAFIAALSLTGSVRAACRAVGKSQFGVTQLLDAAGSEGFRAAYDEAMAMAADERGRRLAEGLRAVAAEQSGWRPPDPPWANAKARGRPPERPALASPDPAPEDTDERRMEVLRGFVRAWLWKVAKEREARLGGQIVAADFYLRQITYIEVLFDLASIDAFEALRAIRLDRCGIIDVAETPFTRLLDEKRRALWAELGEPPRPAPPQRDQLDERDGYSIEPLEHTRGGLPQSHEEQAQAFAERHARDAVAQLEWEAEARRDYERRRDSDAAS